MNHECQKIDLLCILNHLFVVLIKLFSRSTFFFQLMEKSIFMRLLFFSSFFGYFFIHCEYGIDLNVDVPKKPTS